MIKTDISILSEWKKAEKPVEKGWQKQILFRKKRTGSYREKEYFPLLMLL